MVAEMGSLKLEGIFWDLVLPKEVCNILCATHLCPKCTSQASQRMRGKSLLKMQ